jgi:hypothetical protein
MRTRLTFLLVPLAACSDFAFHGDDIDKNGGLDTAISDCRNGEENPSLQLGNANPNFHPWEENAPLFIEVGSEGGMSLPFAIASINTPTQSRLSVTLTLENGDILGTISDKDLTLLCNGADLLISDPQRLTVTWAQDSFELFAVPARLTVRVQFADGQTLLSVVEAEITF